MISWLILTATLPTSPSGLRVSIWRALKTTGCATLREGVYILPSTASTASEFWAIERRIREGGAEAHLLELTARDDAQRQAFQALFDRSESYAEFALSLKEAGKSLRSTSASEARKRLRILDQRLQALLAVDFFAGEPAEAARQGLESLRKEVARQQSPGEPGKAAGDLVRLDAGDFQGQTWATRARPWVDRLATAWLVLRFVDRSPTFLWLAYAGTCPTAALGYDFDGARFTHVNERVTFEVVAASFGLDTDPGVQRLGELVHCIDVGGRPVDEAAGVETLVRGLQVLHPDDDALLAATLPLFDTLLAAFRATPAAAS